MLSLLMMSALAFSNSTLASSILVATSATLRNASVSFLQASFIVVSLFYAFYFRHYRFHFAHRLSSQYSARVPVYVLEVAELILLHQLLPLGVVGQRHEGLVAGIGRVDSATH